MNDDVMYKVEVLLAWENGTWTTEIVEVGEGIYFEAYYEGKEKKLINTLNLIRYSVYLNYRKVVYVGLYNYCPEEEE